MGGLEAGVERKKAISCRYLSKCNLFNDPLTVGEAREKLLAMKRARLDR